MHREKMNLFQRTPPISALFLPCCFTSWSAKAVKSKYYSLQGGEGGGGIIKNQTNPEKKAPLGTKYQI